VKRVIHVLRCLEALDLNNAAKLGLLDRSPLCQQNPPGPQSPFLAELRSFMAITDVAHTVLRRLLLSVPVRVNQTSEITEFYIYVYLDI
jgi:hypothetical protein